MYELKAGDEIQISFQDAPGESTIAVVNRVLNDSQEGLGPEIEDYVACWYEVTLFDGAHASRRSLITLGTDLQYSLDGRKVIVS